MKGCTTAPVRMNSADVLPEFPPLSVGMRTGFDGLRFGTAARSNHTIVRQQYTAQVTSGATGRVAQNPPWFNCYGRNPDVPTDHRQRAIVGKSRSHKRFRAQPRWSVQSKIPLPQDPGLHLKRSIRIESGVNKEVLGMLDAPRQIGQEFDVPTRKAGSQAVEVAMLNSER